MSKRRFNEPVISWLSQRPALWVELPRSRRIDITNLNPRQYRLLNDLAQEALADDLYPHGSHHITEVMRAVLNQVRHTSGRYLSAYTWWKEGE